jgi:hypothetical protein
MEHYNFVSKVAKPGRLDENGKSGDNGTMNQIHTLRHEGNQS